MTTAVAAAPRGQRRKRRPNLTRLNHILVPRRSDQRDRLRTGLAGFLVRPVAWAHGALTQEGRALAGLSLLVAAAGLDVGNSQVYLLWAALTGLIAGSVLVRPWFSMAGTSVEVTAPRRASAFEEITFSIDLVSTRPISAVRLDRPFLPWDGRWLTRTRGIVRLTPGVVARATAKARFVERGEHHLDVFEARALVPFGIAAGAPATSKTCRFLVLPRVARVASVTLPAGNASDRRRIATQRAATDGELGGVRPYRPGDPLRLLHARTWARTGEPHIREHLRERDERTGIVMVVDGTSHEGLIEAAISLTAGVAEALGATVGGLGMVALGDSAETLATSSPRAAVENTLDRLATWAPRPKLAPGDVLAALDGRLEGISGIVLVTADLDLSPGEVPETAALVAEELRQRGLAVRVALVVEEDDREGETPRISRASIESLRELRL